MSKPIEMIDQSLSSCAPLIFITLDLDKKVACFFGNWKNQTGKTSLSVGLHHSCCINLQWQGGPSSNKWSWDWLEGRRLLPTRCPQVDYKMLTCDAFVGKTPGDNVSIENHNWDNLLSISLSAKDFYWRGQVISQAQALRRHLLFSQVWPALDLRCFSV